MRAVRGLLIGIAVVALLATSAPAATVIINNLDGTGEGFNDLTPVAPVGGNPGTRLGQQRLIAFQYAADLWGARLESNVTIVVDAKMDPLYCTATQAVLGSAGATYIHRDFTNAPKTGTWYPQALANALAGAHLNPGTADISATFNSNLNGSGSCLGGRSWYYGFDSNPPGNDIDFVTVVAHEICHGLGFQTFMSSNGTFYNGFPDMYVWNMYHVGNVPPDYISMSVAQRGACNVGDPNLVWDGTAVNLLGNMILGAGVNSGRVRLHGPNPFQSGSSLAHWSTALSPNQVMEPVYTGPNHTVDLELKLLKDIGWVLIPECDPVELACGPVPAKQESFNWPDWTVRVRLDNVGSADAFNVVGLFSDTISTITIPDPSSSYGTIAVTDTSCGVDGYTFDLTDWAGGPFTLPLEVSYEDSCGTVFVDTLYKELTPPPSPVAIADLPDVLDYRLAQSSPNPFNPTARIEYELPETQRVTIRVYDVSGRLVRSLVSDIEERGRHEALWDGRDEAGRRVSSGVYFYRMTAGAFTATRRMVLLK